MGFGLPPLPEHLQEALATPHEHEGEGQEPLWIIWRNNQDGDGWWIDSICNQQDKADYCASAAYQETQMIIIERVPANHRFGSSLKFAKSIDPNRWAGK